MAVGYLAWMVLIRTVIDLLRAEHKPPPLGGQWPSSVGVGHGSDL